MVTSVFVSWAYTAEKKSSDMVMRKAVPVQSSLESSSSARNATGYPASPATAPQTSNASPPSQEGIDFDWDAYEAGDGAESAAGRKDQSSPLSLHKPSTNPFRRRMMSRESNHVPDLITFDPDENNTLDRLNSSSPVIPQTATYSPSTQHASPNLDGSADASMRSLASPSNPDKSAMANQAAAPAALATGPEKPLYSQSNTENIPEITVSEPVPKLQQPGETERAKAKQQRNEFYQIKHIRWFDASSEYNPRVSPILTQNANGPCPLLALVNALVLSTSSTSQTALLDTLQTREQISLGLLIDAVFDELMSDRRRNNMAELPDVTELYSFLITLHTGMNVNPSFVPNSLADASETSNDTFLPGAFEETREMRLYGTFSVPLIHGWLPHKNEKAYAAFERAAPTYEDAQHAQFREEDLQNQLSSDGLSLEDRQLLEDLTTIKQFFVYWPTQLTAHGLDVIDRFLEPGKMAILFRNDHFSTIYKEPRSKRLMTLVTDAGYATHDEIVWETLVDINGANSELCSGDFRSVSHEQPPISPHGFQPMHDEGWTTVQGKGNRSRRNDATIQGSKKPVQQAPPAPPPKANPGGPNNAFGFESLNIETASAPTAPQRTASEQEDHDLALALQLQEEEEERQRNEAAARRARENDLSEQYIARERPFDERGGLRIPVRRSGPQNQNNTPANRSSDVAASGGRDPEAGNDVAPPTYEEAAAERPFHPPRSHPSSEHAPLSPVATQHQNTFAYRPPQEQSPRTPTTGQRGMSARQSLMEQNHQPIQQTPFGPNRRMRSESGVANPQSTKEDRCLVM